MTPEFWQRLKPLYEAALEQPQELRARFVSDACQGDALLKSELRRLLESETKGSFLLDDPMIHLEDLLSRDQETLSVGRVLLHRFQIVRHLGSGGMGDVYEACDLQLHNGRIALKVIRPSIARNPAALTRFKEEVLLARRISGPNVCRIHEFFEPSELSATGSVAFLSMEYLEGSTLSERIEAGPIPLEEASTIAIQLCRALQAIHSAGVIHRDLKPRNIMLVPGDPSEKVVVMDFGLAHAAFGLRSTEGTGKTVPGAIMGTPEYMAPEQFDGREVTPATDIYALGLVLYELVTGRRTFQASTPVAAAVRRGRRIEAPSSMRRGVPAAWDDVITKCLEFDAERRYQTAGDVIAALKDHRLVIWRFRQGQRISLTRRSLMAIAGATLLLLIVAGLSIRRNALIYHMSPTVQQWYDLGATDLREGTYLKATKEFEMAIELDEKYPLTHARLAEAWSELDFTGEAQKQLLFATAPDPKVSLSALEAKYIEAVRTTLIHNYSAAAQDYEEILEELPGKQKPQGMVDLGRAYEKAGRMEEALKRYKEAAESDPTNPAPLVHLGILESRMRDPKTAEEAFNRAKKLYEAKSNLEGEAEVDYQRGYAANEEANDDRAREYLNDSLTIACQINKPQLEVRALSQLSSVAYNAAAEDKTYDTKSFDCANQEIKTVVEKGHRSPGAKRDRDQEALDFANLAIALANQNGLEYWSTDGEMRLGNTYIDKEDYPAAESHLKRALELAQTNQHPRLEAAASFTLASAYIHDENWDEEISSAERALTYYRDYGFVNMSIDASILVSRGQDGKAQYAPALVSGTTALQLATKTNSQLRIIRAEENMGKVLLDLEQYPSALGHAQRALQLSQSTHQLEEYEALQCASILWRLGRSEEAQEKLALIPPEATAREDLATGIRDLQAQMLLSDGQYRKALEVATQSLQTLPSITKASKADFESVIARAEAALGQIAPSSRDADTLLALVREKPNENMIAEAELVEAEISVRAKSAARAMSMAKAANNYFAANNLKDSESLGYLWMAEAAKELGNMELAKVNAKQAIDILHALKQTGETQILDKFSDRPDRKSEIQELSAIAQN